ncbi:FRIGIDA-like protein [Quillaja saponaria]|uniref:FRIGIDA-like protein n=1 Tax=Quillaja saponaria TaxID=32244 RepID=A0AAD7LFI3_QUISA|nr:FRIGIDA-like protein [Quillaja saponaria]
MVEANAVGLHGEYSSQTILTSLLQKSEDTWKRTRQRTHSSAMKEANEKHLAALKSVAKYLDDRRIDPLELFPGWKIKEKIINLEKDISDSKKKMDDKTIQKRKVEEIEPSNKLNSLDIERPRVTAILVSPKVTVLQEQKTATNVDGRSSYMIRWQ